MVKSLEKSWNNFWNWIGIELLLNWNWVVVENQKISKSQLSWLTFRTKIFCKMVQKKKKKKKTWARSDLKRNSAPSRWLDLEEFNFEWQKFKHQQQRDMNINWYNLTIDMWLYQYILQYMLWLLWVSLVYINIQLYNIIMISCSDSRISPAAMRR